MGTPIGSLTELAATPAVGDKFAVVDISEAADADKTKWVSYTNLVPDLRKTSFAVALSDETTVLGAASTTVPLATFRMPFAFTVTEVRASLTTAGTGAALITVDIHDSGTTIMTTTKITIDASEKTSETAATAPVLTDTSLADDAEIELFLDLRDTNNVATGLKVEIIGYPT